MADKVFTMRIDEELLETVRVNAEKNKRSLAKEVEFILEDYYYNKPADDYEEMPPEIAKLFLDFIKQSDYFKKNREK